MIRLVGPGGAGKTTAGAALAQRLRVPFVDVDAEFAATCGDISAYLETHGYHAYAGRNVALHSALVGEPWRSAVVALSSGFMTYRDDVHPGYVRWRQRIASSESTFVLLPSLDLETCVAEIVRRQLRRPFARTPEQEESVIRARFPVYANLPARKVETMRAVDAVVGELFTLMLLREPLHPTAPRAVS
jgi:shikimate kinase